MTCPVIIKRAAIALATLLMIMLGGQSACAQSVTNTAHATWSAGNQNYATSSNTVAFSIVQSPIIIETFVGATANSVTMNFTQALCGSSGTGSQSSQQTATVRQSSTLQVGETFFFQLLHLAGNTSSSIVDGLDVTISTTSGDRESLRVFETGPDTGIFTGAVKTIGLPPQGTQDNCQFSVVANDEITISVVTSGLANPIAQAQINVLADPFGFVFDSENGTPVDGVMVTMVDAATGTRAQVFAPDGITRWPSTIFTGQSVIDAAGVTHTLLPGQYRFPLASPGTYRLVIEPPAPYQAPSTATPAQLAALPRFGGSPALISAASFGGNFILTGNEAVQIDVPVDRPPVSISLTKTASRRTAQPGDVIFYTVTAKNADPLHSRREITITDTPSSRLRLRKDTVRVDGIANPAVVSIASDGGSLTVNLGTIAPNASRVVTYAMTVRPDATPGQALNRANAVDWRGIESSASAVVNVESDNLTGRMTIIGRITEGECREQATRRGVPGVQVMLEDGSFAITDSDGRYHFDGVVPGTHVVAASASTLPVGGQFINCGRSTREAGSATSRFVRGRGGSLSVANFYSKLPEDWITNKGITAGPDARSVEFGLGTCETYGAIAQTRGTRNRD